MPLVRSHFGALPLSHFTCALSLARLMSKWLKFLNLQSGISPCPLWWSGTSARCRPGWTAGGSGPRRSAGRARAPRWWTPPGSARTSPPAGGSLSRRGSAPASSASPRRPRAGRTPAAPAAAPSAARGGARGWWPTCPPWLPTPAQHGTASALILLTTGWRAASAAQQKGCLVESLMAAGGPTGVPTSMSSFRRMQGGHHSATLPPAWGGGKFEALKDFKKLYFQFFLFVSDCKEAAVSSRLG